MIFEFIISCRTSSSQNVIDEITSSFTIALEDSLNEFDDNDANNMVRLKHERIGSTFESGHRTSVRHMLLGFSLELPDGFSADEALIDNFVEGLSDSAIGFHVIGFEDPLLRSKLAVWASELFALEMKLRRVLSLIYIHRYQDSSPYDLLKDESVKPMKRPSEQQMRNATENQFFHLLFSDYIGLNQSPIPRLNDVLKFVRSYEEYDALRAEVLRRPIQDEIDAGLLAGIEIHMDTIEQMRNCVAHNRRPPRRVLRNYPTARSRLEEQLDEYLRLWEV